MKPIKTSTIHEVVWSLLKSHFGQEILRRREDLLKSSPHMLLEPQFEPADNDERMALVLAAGEESAWACPVLQVLRQGVRTASLVELSLDDLRAAISSGTGRPFGQNAAIGSSWHSSSLLSGVSSIPAMETDEVPPLRWNGEINDPWDFHRSIWTRVEGQDFVLDGTHRLSAVLEACEKKMLNWPRLRAYVLPRA